MTLYWPERRKLNEKQQIELILQSVNKIREKLYFQE